jgi:hypothetical protein
MVKEAQLTYINGRLYQWITILHRSDMGVRLYQRGTNGTSCISLTFHPFPSWEMTGAALVLTPLEV